MKPRRPDTGHPDGLYRVLVHADGHVVLFAGNAADVPRLEARAAALAESGVTGYTLGWMPLDEAAGRYAYSVGCACALTEGRRVA
jgi:hypothetical protein